MAKSSNAAVKIIIAVVVIAVVAGIIGVIAWLTNGFKDNVKTFGVRTETKLYVNNADGLYIKSGQTFEMVLPFSDKYNVRVVAKTADEDITIVAGDQSCMWNEIIAGNDLTEQFGIDMQPNGFTLNYVSLSAVVSGYLGIEATVHDTQELFDLYVESGGTMRFGFRVCVAIGGIELDPDNVVFKGAL